MWGGVSVRRGSDRELVECMVGVLLRRCVWVVIIVEVDASGEPSVGG